MPPFRSGDFVIGANLPWIRYGIDFGANLWRRHGGVAQSDTLALLDDKLAQVAAAHISIVRWFLLCDGRAGIEFSADSRPRGLDAHVFPDMDAAIDAVGRHGLRVMFVLVDFGWCKRATHVNGVQLGGRRRVLKERSSRQLLLDRVFRPILQRYREDQTIAAWDIINEPEWVTFGLGSTNPASGLTRAELRAFIEESASLIHEVTDHPVTVGSAGSRWRSFYRRLSLDFDQVHWYDALAKAPPLEMPVEKLGFDRPVLLGEFPTSASARSVNEILETARTAGYVGAFEWPS
ncbi:MAG: hypothetical protein ACRD1Q_10535 [Vicinamibacterales bacterium]